MMNQGKYKNLQLTPDQLKAAKSVYRAMRKAEKLGVHFWDNYGKLYCYNANKIKRIVIDGMEKEGDINIEDYDITYHERLSNFYAGNADDPLFAEPV